MAMTLISTSTADGSANIAITSGIDSTYKLYIIQCINVNLVAANTNWLSHQFSTDGGSSYGVSTQSNMFRAYHYENDSGASISLMEGAFSLANSTAYQPWSDGLSNDDDQGFAATLWLFNPSNTTYVKHWYGRGVGDYGGIQLDTYPSGYVNTTSAVNAINFKAYTGNIDEGTFKLYGVG
jgi:hypothetical protein